MKNEKKVEGKELGSQACLAKILMDGNGLKGFAEGIVTTASNLSNEQVAALDDSGYKIIEYLNAAEENAIAAQKALLKAVSYCGPLPSYLQDKKVG